VGRGLLIKQYDIVIRGGDTREGQDELNYGIEGARTEDHE